MGQDITYMETAGSEYGFDKHNNASGQGLSNWGSNVGTNDKECWQRFERSGMISDYLNYSACTKEI